MEKELFRFISGEVNAVKLSVILVKEILPNGIEHITVKAASEEDYLICQQWINAKKVASEKLPKHTGGKKPYIILMVDEVEKLRADGVRNVEELIGYLACLGRFIEWNTGKLIRKRSKKPIQYKDLQEIFPCGNRKLNRILNDLKEHDLLFYTDEGYFISPKFIKKGKTKK